MTDLLARSEIAQLRALVALISSSPAVINGETVVGVPFDFATPSPLILGQIKAGHILNRAAILIEVSFNGANPTVSFGTTTSPSLYLGPSDLSPKVAGQYESDALRVAAADDILILTIVPDGSSTGAGVVFFKLYP